MALIAVSANSVDAAGVGVEETLPVAWLDAELAGTEAKAQGPGHVSARLSRSGNDVVVRGRVRASMALPCARCLNPAVTVVDTELALLLVPASPAPAAPGTAKKKVAPREPSPHRDLEKPKATGHTNGSARLQKGEAREPVEREFTSEEAERDTFDGETVVLDDFVREAILLELPNFPLCSETCPGIARAASDLSAPESAPRLDPRLAPLRALRARIAAEGPAGRGEARSRSGPKPRTKKKKTKE